MFGLCQAAAGPHDGIFRGAVPGEQPAPGAFRGLNSRAEAGGAGFAAPAGQAAAGFAGRDRIPSAVRPAFRTGREPRSDEAKAKPAARNH